MSEGGRLRVTYDGNTLTFRPDEVVTVGRHPDSAVLVLHSKVSRHHAEVRCDDGLWVLTDAGSANGTFVAGELVTSLRLVGPVKVNVGEIDGPSLTLVPEVVAEGSAAIAGETVSIGAEAASPLRSATSSLSADVVQRFRHQAAVVRIGRAPDNDVIIDEDGVSWYHAELRVSEGSADLVDLNSKNGTYVNGRAVERVQLSELDLVAVGSAFLRFTGDTLDLLPDSST